MQRPDETQIMAYVDGELDDAAMAEIERVMEADPDFARYIRDLLDSNAALRAAFNAPMREPVPERLLAPLGAQRARPWRMPSGRRLLAMAASVAAIVVVGGGLALSTGYELPYTITANAPDAWLSSVANYYQAYARTAEGDERSLVDVNAEDVDYLENWFGQRLKRDVRLPKLENQGFKMQGGRVTFIEGQPGAQFFYKSVTGDAIVSVAIAQTKRRDTEWTTAKRNGLRMIYWRKGGYVYVFAGDVDKHVLHGVASAFPDDQRKT
ncbi:MAG: anti-sigma factor [Alphaproteobacteria bacterium]|nr:anti-sigma factor [Alphaproteobacteria bacterium]